MFASLRELFSLLSLLLLLLPLLHYYTSGFCLISLFPGDHSRLGRILRRSSREEPLEIAGTRCPSCHQRTVSKHRRNSAHVSDIPAGPQKSTVDFCNSVIRRQPLFGTCNISRKCAVQFSRDIVNFTSCDGFELN